MHPTLSVLCLVVAALAGLGLACLRADSGIRWRPFLLAGLVTLAMLTVGLAWLSPTGLSYRGAENTRVVHGALEDLKKGLPGADCVVFVDGSSCSAHALDVETLRKELVRHGHSPCIVSLVNHGSEHLEREWAAQELRKLMPEALRASVDELPVLWAKEIFYQYESHPARFAAQNRGSERMLAWNNAKWGTTALRALWTDWKDQRKNSKMNLAESWEAFPADRFAATFNHLLFNLFQCGRLARLSSPPTEPLHVLESMAALPDDPRPRKWWSEVPPPGTKEKRSATLRPRRWFKALAVDAPSGWPKREGLECVLHMPPVQNRTVLKYSALLEEEGFAVPVRFINGQADAELVKRLHRPELWQDTVHLDRDGARLYSAWLAGKLGPVISDLRLSMLPPVPALSFSFESQTRPD